MKNQLYDNPPKSLQIGAGRWVQISPDHGKGYRIFDPIAEVENGRILFDDNDNWIYEGAFVGR